MVGGMVPPIAIALSTTFCPKKWTADERRNGIVNYVMGCLLYTSGNQWKPSSHLYRLSEQR